MNDKVHTAIVKYVFNNMFAFFQLRYTQLAVTSLETSRTPPIAATAMGDAGKIAINPNIAKYPATLVIDNAVIIKSAAKNIQVSSQVSSNLLSVLTANEHST